MFGAAVRADDTPSPALAHRIASAVAASRLYPDAALLCTGAVGRHGASEASVMGRLIGTVIDDARLHLDETSSDTLQSVRAAAAFMRANGFDVAIACTDRYHQPRVRMLFALAGVRSRGLAMPHVGSGAYLRRMRLREAIAIPYDLIAGIAQLRRRR
ncbi:YdcF family protein [Sphingomonas oligophenolica]|uniref:YdcF family protein n=1 Tax=Sphingomonas oligophenolica TaxID=301154 RepID=UPI00138674CB|nr:YdcF family protein [Sphingomonas oligophenolica]